jgi:hypothetical protein
LLAAVAGVAGCSASSSGAPTGVDAFGLPLRQPVTQAELRAHGESRLLYPGSRVASRVGSDERARPGLGEPDPAYAGAVAVARATPAALYAWYDRRLVGQGWRRAAYYRTSEQVTGRAWTVARGTEQVQVAVYAPGSGVGRRLLGAAPRGRVAYEEVLVDYRVTGPPPAPAGG